MRKSPKDHLGLSLIAWQHDHPYTQVARKVLHHLLEQSFALRVVIVRLGCRRPNRDHQVIWFEAESLANRGVRPESRDVDVFLDSWIVKNTIRVGVDGAGRNHVWNQHPCGPDHREGL